jgi:hypothetical protein
MTGFAYNVPAYLAKRTQFWEYACRGDSVNWVYQKTIIDTIGRRHGRHLAIPAGCQSEDGVAYDDLRHRA